MKKQIFFILTISILLAGCEPFGITGNPNSTIDTDENDQHQDGIEAMGNIEEFPITINEFEYNIEKQDYNNHLKETNIGYISKDKLFKLEYKGDKSDPNEYLKDIYIFVDVSNYDITKVENEFKLFLEAIFTALETSYDSEVIISKIKEKQQGMISTPDKISVELTGSNDSIQLIIKPE